MARVSRLSIRKRSIANPMQSCSTFDIKFKFDLSIKKENLIKSEKSMRVSLPSKRFHTIHEFIVSPTEYASRK